MSCGNTSCLDQQGFDLDAAGSGSSIGFLPVMPEEFTRDELQALLSKARTLSQYGIFDDTKRDLMVDLAETLDLLDALEARDEADLAELKETIAEHGGSGGVTVGNKWPT